MDKAVHETHKETRELWSFYTQNRQFIISMAEITMDFFQPWLAEHPAPPGMPIKEPVNWPDTEED